MECGKALMAAIVTSVSGSRARLKAMECICGAMEIVMRESGNRV
jgi:hypothetical protein